LRKRLTELEEQVYQAWDALIFPNGSHRGLKTTREAFIDQLHSDLPYLFAMLTMAHDGEAWKVGPGIASLVSGSIWSTAMPLRDYELAENAVVRCLAHHEAFDRGDSADLPRKLYVARIAHDLNSSAWQDLIDHIDCGIYRPAEIARSTYYTLSPLFPPMGDDEQTFDSLPLSVGAKALAVKFALTFKTSKKHLRAAEDLKTWDEFGRSLAFSIGLPPLDANGRAELAPMPNPPE